MIRLSESILSVGESPTIAAAARAKELQAQGRDIVSFTVGEPDLDTPQHVKDAAKEAIDKGHTKYTATGGIPALRKALSEKLAKYQGLNYPPEQIIVTNGGKQAIAAACAVLLNPGDEVIIPAPYWTSYPDMVKLAGGRPVIVETFPEQGYLMSPKDLEQAIGPKTKMLILCSPSNPTGSCYGAAELRALGEVILSHKYGAGVVVLSDEVYEHITYDSFQAESFASVVPECRDRTLVVNAFSKAYSMTGWRVGYAAGPKEIIKAMVNHQSQFTTNVCSIAQYAALCAYEDGGEFPRFMLEKFKERLEILIDKVQEIPGVKLYPKPRGAFYAFLRIDGLIGKRNGDVLIRSGNDLAAYLLEKYDVAVVQGEAFGCPNAVRLSFALSNEQLLKGLERIKQAAESLG